MKTVADTKYKTIEHNGQMVQVMEIPMNYFTIDQNDDGCWSVNAAETEQAAEETNTSDDTNKGAHTMQTQTKTQTITATNTTATIEPFPRYFSTLQEYKDLLTSDDDMQRYIMSNQAARQGIYWARRVKEKHGLETVMDIIQTEMTNLSFKMDPLENWHLIEFESRVLGRVAQHLTIDFFYHIP